MHPAHGARSRPSAALRSGQRHRAPGRIPGAALRSEPSFRKEFAETGFLTDKRGRFLVTDLDDSLLGIVVYFDVNFMDGSRSAVTCSTPHRATAG